VPTEPFQGEAMAKIQRQPANRLNVFFSGYLDGGVQEFLELFLFLCVLGAQGRKRSYLVHEPDRTHERGDEKGQVCKGVKAPADTVWVALSTHDTEQEDNPCAKGRK